MEAPEPVEAEEPHEGSGRSGIALCLSGGGYRATLFHLGAARRLHELGLLEQVDTISGVSGGSLFAGVLADVAVREGWTRGLEIEDFEAQVAGPVRRVAQRDMRTVPFLVHLPYNWLVPGPRAEHLVRLCTQHISAATLEALPDRPRFVFSATDLAFGVNWEASKRRTGDFQAGYLRDGGRWPVGRAVAASACFPPVFGPLRVGAGAADFVGGDAPRDGRNTAYREGLSLSDGGVYDNAGLEPVWKTHRHVLVSDCGAPFEFRAGGHVIRRLMRYTTVVQKQARAARTRMFYGDIDDRRYAGARWSLTTDVNAAGPGYSAPLVREVLTRIRTDVDRFSTAEQRVLENHGYCVTERRLQDEAPELLPPPPCPPAVPPHRKWMDEERVRSALRASHRRVSLRRLAGRQAR